MTLDEAIRQAIIQHNLPAIELQTSRQRKQTAATAVAYYLRSRGLGVFQDGEWLQVWLRKPKAIPIPVVKPQGIASDLLDDDYPPDDEWVKQMCEAVNAGLV